MKYDGYEDKHSPPPPPPVSKPRSPRQGGRTWQPFVEGKNCRENFRQARIYNFRDKDVIFAHNRKFANLTHYNMQYIPCNSALLAQETLFLTQKGTFFAQKVRKSRQILIRDKIAYVQA